MDAPLTPAEDADLRRLALLHSYGELSPEPAKRYAELRGRDRRAVVREPCDVVIPIQRAAADGPLVSR